MAGTGEKSGGPTRPWIVLVIGAVGVVINVVDLIAGGAPEPHAVFPLLLVLWAAGELLNRDRPAAARVARGAAGVLLVVAGLAAGIPAAAALARGGAVDWLDLVLGVLTLLYAASVVAALAARSRARRPVAEPAVGEGVRIGENGPHERS
ncbi:hypothetical protein ACF068_16180 [Streptomyces sp. NPDC016309]|uniref:hypothetical protein n=1 Tax=Streptomyces sp. NPDC016309 TaxID=3364965 RepID=UPI0036F9E5E0